MMKIAVYMNDQLFKALENCANQDYRQVRSQIIVILENYLQKNGHVNSIDTMEITATEKITNKSQKKSLTKSNV